MKPSAFAPLSVLKTTGFSIGAKSASKKSRRWSHDFKTAHYPIVLVSGEDCPNSLFEPSHESGVVGTPQRFTRVAQPNVDARFALAGYVLE